MYNTEKFIGECLDSLLNQTFQNFEVIVVDDCSTDSSCAIVESYAPKFNGRLIMAKTEKNSGSGALPRNKGIELARGEYVFFMDADDLVTPTALEEMYTLAKEYKADVVYCEKYRSIRKVNGEFVMDDECCKGKTQPLPFVDKPTFETQNMVERV